MRDTGQIDEAFLCVEEGFLLRYSPRCKKLRGKFERKQEWKFGASPLLNSPQGVTVTLGKPRKMLSVYV